MYAKLKVICFYTPAEKEAYIEIAYFNHLSLVNRKWVLVHTPAPVLLHQKVHAKFSWYKSMGEKT